MTSSGAPGLCAHHQPLRVGRRGAHRRVRRCGGGARSADADYRCGRDGAHQLRRPGDGQFRQGARGCDGAAGEGDWRLELSSTLELEVLSYIRTEPRRLPDQHARLRAAHRGGASGGDIQSGQQRHPGEQSAARQPRAARPEVRIEGVDDKGDSPGTVVTLSLGVRGVAHGQRQGPGVGRGVERRCARRRGRQVAADGEFGTAHRGDECALDPDRAPDQPLHRAGNGGAPGDRGGQVFREHISGPVVQSKCVNCHVAGRSDRGTRGWCSCARRTTRTMRHTTCRCSRTSSRRWTDGAGTSMLNKIRGEWAHGGGTQVPAGTPDYENMERFLRLLGEDVKPVTLTPQTLFDTVTMAPARKTLRRAALILAGRTPSDEEYAAAQRGGSALRETIRGLMTGPEFHDFLIRAANDRLLTNRSGQIIDANLGFHVDFVNETWQRKKEAHESGDVRELSRYYLWNDRTQHGFRRAPLELIAHVVENDRPYTEILTADYIMANPWSAAAYGASTRFDDPDDVHEFKPSEIVSYYRRGDGYESEFDRVVNSERVLNPGPLITDYPHAGILNTTAFLYRYPTTATNRNRARSRWTWYHFLGLDIEKSASRTTDPDALADTNNPTLLNPACTVCHTGARPHGRHVPELWRRGVLQGQVGRSRLHRRLLQERGRDDSGAPGRVLAQPGHADLVTAAGGGDPDLEGGLHERLLRGGHRPGWKHLPGSVQGDRCRWPVHPQPRVRRPGGAGCPLGSLRRSAIQPVHRASRSHPPVGWSRSTARSTSM